MVMPLPMAAYEPDQFVIAILQSVELPVQIIDSPLDIAAARLALAQCQPPACASLAKSRYERRTALQLRPKPGRFLAVQNQSCPKLSAEARTEISQCPSDARNQ
jgi:hypothetical protein